MVPKPFNQTGKRKTKLYIQMNTSTLIFIILFVLFVLFWVYALATAEPYPEELEREEEERILKIFEEYKKSQK